MDVLTRQNLGVAAFRGSTFLKMYMQPAGNYLAVQNDHLLKGNKKCSVEVFDLTQSSSVPHKILKIEREI